MSETFRKIVIIDPETETIKKTYESKKELCDDLGIKKSSNINKCLSRVNLSCKKYIIRYEEDVTQENLKAWIEQYKSLHLKKIVVIDPVTQTIHKTYSSTKEVCTDLNIPNSGLLSQSLNDSNVSCYGYIIKYEKDVTQSNIIDWSNKMTRGINNERKCPSCNNWYPFEFRKYCKTCVNNGTYYNKMNGKKIVLIDPITCTIHKIYNTMKEAAVDLKIDNTSNIISCIEHTTNQCNGYILKREEDAIKENIEIWVNQTIRGLNGERKCFSCKTWYADFTGDYCEPCEKKIKREHVSTPNGYFKNMITSMTIGAANRTSIGRTEAGLITIDRTFLISLFKEQNGMCYYSGLPMVHMPLHDWQCSPERLDNSKGYIPENVKLICLEFNSGYGQWNKNKIMQIKQMKNKQVSFDKLKNDIEIARIIYKEKIERLPPIEVNGVTLYHCVCCELHLNRNFFKNCKKKGVIPVNLKCDTCILIKQNKSKNTIGKFLMAKMIGAKAHCNQIKNNKKRSDENSIFELTLDILLKKVLDQKGRCYYSGIPLTFTFNSEWRCSLERLDNKKGYTDKNTVLICVEFNSTDRSSITNTDTGSGQWSQEKFDYFMKNSKYVLNNN